MPRAASGSYSASASTFNPAAAGTEIDPVAWNSLLADFTTTLTDSWSRSGKGAALANLSMGGFKLTSVGLATTAADAMSRSASDIRYQPLKTPLTAIGSVSPSANKAPYFSSTTSAALYSINAGARARNGVTVGANVLVYNTTSTSAASASFTAAGRAIVAATSASAQTALLVVGKGATSSSAGTKGLVKAPSAGDQAKFYRGDSTWQTIAGGGDLLSSNNLSDVANAATSLGNLGGAPLAGNKNLTGGFTTTSSSRGLINATTFSPSATNGYHQHGSVKGAWTLGVPGAVGSIVFEATNSSASSLTTSSYGVVTGDTYSATGTKRHLFYINKTKNTSSVHIEYVTGT